MRARRPRPAALAAGALLLFAPSAAAEAPCVAPGEGVLLAGCPGAVAAEILLLPEDAARLAAPDPGSLTITGAYTATDTRDGERPKPVGVFVRGGERVSLELARMDGLLIVGADGAATIATVADAPLGGTRHDLTSLEGRVAFAEAARAAGASALQSHLLIRDGALDVRPVEDAPSFRRRLLFQTADGALGVWDSGARLLTLHEAAEELRAAHAPRMALNLDMGSYDYCERVDGDGAASRCGVLSRESAGRLSNAIRLRATEGAGSPGE